ncbi:MAG: NifU family protein [Candidatus Melainabacteria bacterium]|nr:NifU family protein [Candidatus Melainabacteria bacterium]
MPTQEREKSTEATFDNLLARIQALEIEVSSFSESERNTVNALRLSIDALNKEAFARLIRALKSNPAALSAMKDAIKDDLVYSVLRHHELIKPALAERIEKALASVRPFLESHGGDVELIAVEPPSSVTIRLKGACSNCPASDLTLREGVEKAIREVCPEIVEIKRASSLPGGQCASSGQAIAFISPFADQSEAGWLFAAAFEAIPDAGVGVFDVQGRSILLSRFGEKITCYENACAHMGMPLDGGVFKDGILTCPHHQFQYHLESGECLTAPEVQLHTHAVRVKGKDVEVKLS